MKKLLIIALLCVPAFAQNSDRNLRGQLTSTCSNTNSTCDVLGTTVFGGNGDVLGPQTIEANVQGYGLAQITVSGTYSGSTLNFEFSDDGGTTWYTEVCARTDANVQESSEAVATNAFRAIECSVGAATRFRIRQSAITTGGPVVGLTLTSGIVEPAPTVSFTNTPGSTDPCQNTGVIKSSVAVAISTATTTRVIAPVAGQTIYACSFGGTAVAGTAATYTWEYGTGGTCGTGTTLLTGALTGGGFFHILGEFHTASAAELCIVTGGTGPNYQGILTYVQQ